MKIKEVEVLIIGGGASGYATAIPLARAGIKVLLVDQEKGHIHKGELLTPKARPLLEELYCWEKFISDNHQECPGIISSWGTSEPVEVDFISNPYGMGWLINKKAMQKMFAAELTSLGGEIVLTNEKVIPENKTTGSWNLGIGEVMIRATFLVNATGRKSLPSLSKGKITNDKQVALIRVGKWSPEHKDMRLQIEAAENGWGYLSFHPDGQVIHGFVSDSDLIPKGKHSQNTFLTANHAMTPHISKRLRGFDFSPSSIVVPANTYLRKQVAGKDWLSVGDAAIATDPLSGQGILKALQGGIRAAKTIIDLKHQSIPNLREYSLDLLKEFERFNLSRISNYQKEQRWSDSPFWSRRSHLNTI